jgi:hypothetical protein
MDSFTATGIAEGFIEADSEDQVIEAWQTLIDTGLVWQLQGWFGRQARALIEDGTCLPAEESRLLRAAKALGKIEFVKVGA